MNSVSVRVLGDPRHACSCALAAISHYQKQYRLGPNRKMKAESFFESEEIAHVLGARWE